MDLDIKGSFIVNLYLKKIHVCKIKAKSCYAFTVKLQTPNANGCCMVTQFDVTKGSEAVCTCCAGVLPLHSVSAVRLCPAV